MDADGKIVMIDCPGDHLQFSDTWFTENIIGPYFMWTTPATSVARELCHMQHTETNVWSDDQH